MRESEGPWSVVREGDKLIITSAVGEYICHVCEDMYSPKRVASGEMTSNFVLMSMAPELRKTLEKLRAIINGGREEIEHEKETDGGSSDTDKK